MPTLLVLLALLPAPQSAPVAPRSPIELAEDLATLAASAREQWAVPGLALAVVHEGEVVLERGFGTRTIGGEESVDEHTMFAVGSTTKAMTAALLGTLVDEGALKLDDPVRQHLDGFSMQDPVAAAEVSVRDLLTHRAGLGNADLLWYGADRSRQEIVAAIARIPSAYPFRRGFIYQNVMYVAAGEVAAAAGGASFEQLLHERLFEPLAMSRTSATTSAAQEYPNVARPHHWIDGEVSEIENEPLDEVAAAGAVWSSVHDMAQWLGMWLAEGEWRGQRVLEESQVAELLAPQVLLDVRTVYPYAGRLENHWSSYAHGWFQVDRKGVAVSFHTGSIDGMSAIVGIVPAHALGFVAFANLDHAELRHALLWQTVDWFCDIDGPDWNAELRQMYGDPGARQAQRQRAMTELEQASADPVDPQDFVGTYSHPLYGEVMVTVAEGSLCVDAGARSRATLEHANHDTFVAHPDRRWRGAQPVTFRRSAGGVVESLEMLGQSYRRSR